MRFPSLLQKFISDGANVNATVSYGRTPLLQALFINPDLSNYSHFRVINAEVVKMLIDAGAKVNVTDSQGLTLLLQALINRTIHAEVVKMLIDAGAKVNVTDSQGRTPLRFALMNNGSVKKIDELIKAGASLKGVTFVDAIKHYAYDSLLDAIIRKGADINAVLPSQFGGPISPLWYTLLLGKNIYESLLERGADVNKHIDRLIQSNYNLTRLTTTN